MSLLQARRPVPSELKRQFIVQSASLLKYFVTATIRQWTDGGSQRTNHLPCSGQGRSSRIAPSPLATASFNDSPASSFKVIDQHSSAGYDSDARTPNCQGKSGSLSTSTAPNSNAFPKRYKDPGTSAHPRDPPPSTSSTASDTSWTFHGVLGRRCTQCAFNVSARGPISDHPQTYPVR